MAPPVNSPRDVPAKTGGRALRSSSITWSINRSVTPGAHSVPRHGKQMDRIKIADKIRKIATSIFSRFMPAIYWGAPVFCGLLRREKPAVLDRGRLVKIEQAHNRPPDP